MRRLDEIIVHCSATRPDWMADNRAQEKVDEITRWHVDGRGWSDIGYHYFIDRNGTIVECRPISKKGAHVRGHNADTLAVCLAGGHGSNENDNFLDNFTPEQDAALRGLIDRLKDEHPTITKVTGHNEYAAKACPGFNVSRWLAEKPAKRTSIAESTTIQAAATTGVSVSGITAIATALGELDPNTQIAVVALAGVSLVALGWIARERIRRWAKGDR